MKGGAGGTGGNVSPANSTLYEGTPSFVNGSSGSNGNIDHNAYIDATGGSSALISNKGTLSSFGGGSGAIYKAGDATYTGAKNGGGGIGLWQQDGIKGGDGLVMIVYKYYTEE